MSAVMEASNVKKLLASAGHADCVDGVTDGFYHPKEGLVCACGSILGHPGSAVASLADEAQQLPAGAPSSVAEDPIKASLALLDPNQLVTPEMVEERIVDSLRRLEHGMAYENQVITAHYQAKVAYELASARAFVASEERSAEARKADALIKCEDLYAQMQHAELIRKTVATTMHTLRSALSGYQTLLRSVSTVAHTGGSSKDQG